jgi:type IX secretion system PorP/SprF family membrane protein
MKLTTDTNRRQRNFDHLKSKSANRKIICYNFPPMRLRLLSLICCLVVLVLSANKLTAQDIHYSQYYAQPMTLNPALTGKFDGEWRAGAIYRSQWASVVKPMFVTPSAFVDFSLLKTQLKNDALGIGLYFLNDKQNDGALSTNQIGVSVAYHKGLGEGGKYQLSLGFQGGYIQKKLDLGDLRFADVFDNNLQPTLTSQEAVAGDSENYIDINTGLFFSGQFTDWMTFYTGFSLWHLTTPDEQFISSTGDNQLPMRYVPHAGIEFKVNDKITVIPGVLFQAMAKTKETNFGATVGYNIVQKEKMNASIYLGLWHRWKDSVIPKIGLEVQNLRVGFAYDVTTSSLKDLKNADNGGKLPTSFELYLTYIGNFFQPKEDVYLFNPRY